MFIYKFLLAAWGALLWAFSSSSFTLPQKIEGLKQSVSLFTYANRFDSAQAVILQLLEEKNLSEFEIFYCHYLFADVLKSSGKPDKALIQLQDCKNFIEKIPENVKYESLIEGNIAECYFNQMKYKEAKEHSLLAIRLNPDSSLRDGGHSVNYLIVGYCEYLVKNYQSSLQYYYLAYNEYNKHGEKCELPLVYAKMASVYNALGNQKLTEECVHKAIFVSDSCKIDTYRLLSMYAMLDIFKENNDYEKALRQLEDINTLVEKIEKQKQHQLVSELEVKYKTILMQNENRNLQQLNSKNNEILLRQKLALRIAIAALVILSILIVVLIRVSGQRKKAERKLSVLNSELENIVAERTRNLTEANEKIRENGVLLSSQNSQLVDFCNMVSHNLRSPLINMSVLINLIEKSGNITEQQQILSKLRPVINSLRETFDELLESLAIRQDREIKSEKVALKDCLQRTRDGLEGEIINSHALIESDFTGAPVIFYPPKYLYSIFHNLISNALKYKSNERKPLIRIESRKSGSNIILSVSDNGLGIDMEKHKDNIFKIRKVFHEHPDAKGFGLFITKAQVEAMGGRIWVNSSPGTGSDFFVEFIGSGLKEVAD